MSVLSPVATALVDRAAIASVDILVIIDRKKREREGEKEREWNKSQHRQKLASALQPGSHKSEPVHVALTCL